MKKYNKLELIGFIILMIGFILYIIGSFVEIPFISAFKNKLLFTVSLGLLLWSLGHMKREKEQREKEQKEKEE